MPVGSYKLTRAQQRRAAEAILTDVYRSLEHLPRPVLLKVIPILKRAEGELTADLRRFFARRRGSARFTAQAYRNSLFQIRRALEYVAELEPALVSSLGIVSRRAGMLATAHVESEALRLANIFEMSIRPIALDATIIIASGEHALFKRFKKSARRYRGAVGDSITRELAVSRVRGETMTQAATRLEKRIPGTFRGAHSRAEMVARTEIMHAYNVQHEIALRHVAREESGWLARWDATFDRRTCPECARMDGTIADVAHGVNFAGGVDRPPLHPRCRCVMTPWRRDWDADLLREIPADPASAAAKGASARAATRQLGVRR